MARRKRIAVLMSQLEEQYQNGFIEGFFSQAFKYDYDVCVFASHQKEPESSIREVAEKNIFSLVNYDLFDAVVVLPDILQVSGLMMKIEKDLREKFKGKVVYVDRESSEFPYVMMKHYDPIYRLVSHLIEVHGYKDIAFVTGHKWHIHSKERLQAFMDCMEDHGLEVPEDHIYFGDYWYTGGVTVVEDMIREGRKIPEAIACANDYMAIAVAETFVKHGYRVPEDVAVVGYDSVKEGQTCPAPITSIGLPTKDFGGHIASCIHALVEGKEMPEFVNREPIFKGSSCGCHNESINAQMLIHQSWDLVDSRKNYFASFNRLTEDLVLQSTFKGLIDAIQTYSYQIREFELFALCLNDVWVNDSPISETVIKQGYTKYMAPVLKCGPTGKGADIVDYNARFLCTDLIPDLHEECDHPRSFIFTPVFFDDITFGYSVLSYGDVPKAYSENYYMWMRSVMTAMECYRRNTGAKQNSEHMEDLEISDSLTGMFNYKGFVKHAKPMIERSTSINNYISILAMDLEGLEKINSKYGRKEGDQAIHDFAFLVFGSVDEGAMCCRLGNDELLIAELTDQETSEHIMKVQSRIIEAMDKLNAQKDRKYELKAYFGNATAKAGNLSQMEDLVNIAVSNKNGNKASEQKLKQSADFNAEDIAQAKLVKKILDENLFTYNFQPIVNAQDGSIYSYEALMRSKTEKFVSPLDIIKYAEYLGRLLDVEKATFFNVLNFMENHRDEFEGKKVFINSIPGYQLNEKDSKTVAGKMSAFNGSIVVELTEKAEASDEYLSDMKDKFEKLGVETAVDDYGTGYSNIVNLLRYMPDYVKIDRMLLTGIQDNPHKQHFVKDIVLFAHDNHFKVLAEGVETVEELETVIKLGVDLIQGYYTARPSATVLQEIDGEIVEQIKTFAASI